MDMFKKHWKEFGLSAILGVIIGFIAVKIKNVILGSIEKRKEERRKHEREMQIADAYIKLHEKKIEKQDERMGISKEEREKLNTETEKKLQEFHDEVERILEDPNGQLDFEELCKKY